MSANKGTLHTYTLPQMRKFQDQFAVVVRMGFIIITRLLICQWCGPVSNRISVFELSFEFEVMVPCTHVRK